MIIQEPERFKENKPGGDEELRDWNHTEHSQQHFACKAPFEDTMSLTRDDLRLSTMKDER